MGAYIKLEGVAELQKKLRNVANPDEIKRIVRKNGADLQQRMHCEAVFTKGYSTGATQGSISLKIADGGETAVVGPEMDYSEYLEYGTRRMEPQPFVEPSFDAQKDLFLRDIEKLITSRTK